MVTRSFHSPLQAKLKKIRAATLVLLLQVPVYFYRYFFSPLLHAWCGPGCGCRFFPSCSVYWSDALKKHGPLYGLRLSLSRLARCHPWNRGGYDPVPEPATLQSNTPSPFLNS